MSFEHSDDGHTRRAAPPPRPCAPALCPAPRPGPAPRPAPLHSPNLHLYPPKVLLFLQVGVFVGVGHVCGFLGAHKEAVEEDDAVPVGLQADALVDAVDARNVGPGEHRGAQTQDARSEVPVVACV